MTWADFHAPAFMHVTSSSASFSRQARNPSDSMKSKVATS